MDMRFVMLNRILKEHFYHDVTSPLVQALFFSPASFILKPLSNVQSKATAISINNE
jgi:hypothetical protein